MPKPVCPSSDGFDYVEYWSWDHLVLHRLRPKGRKTLCGDKVTKMLPARQQDLLRAFTEGEDTILARCWDCAVAG